MLVSDQLYERLIMFGGGEHIADNFTEAEMLNHKMSLLEDAEIQTLRWADGEAPII